MTEDAVSTTEIIRRELENILYSKQKALRDISFYAMRYYRDKLDLEREIAALTEHLATLDAAEADQ